MNNIIYRNETFTNKILDLPKQPELEWQLGVPFWNKGYATEIGKAVIQSAFKGSDITKIYGMDLFYEICH